MWTIVILSLLAVGAPVQGWLFGSDDEPAACDVNPDTSTVSIGFKVYTQGDPSQSLGATPSQADIAATTFVVGTPFRTVVYIPGSQANSTLLDNIARQTLYYHNYVNVITVQWLSTDGAITNSNTPAAGKSIANLIRSLVTAGAPNGTFHLVGQGLGAHVAGFAGQELGGTIDEITGLDPVARCFEGSAANKRLSSGDAKFVSVIHSDTDGSGTQSGVGYKQPLGDADFYPNGGANQPGCGADNAKCSHERAAEYFFESLSTKERYSAYPCTIAKVTNNQWSECGATFTEDSRMGYFATSAKTGVFAMATEDKSPFSKTRCIWC